MSGLPRRILHIVNFRQRVRIRILADARHGRLLRVRRRGPGEDAIDPSSEPEALSCPSVAGNGSTIAANPDGEGRGGIGSETDFAATVVNEATARALFVRVNDREAFFAHPEST